MNTNTTNNNNNNDNNDNNNNDISNTFNTNTESTTNDKFVPLFFNNYDEYNAPKPQVTIFNPNEGKNLSQRKCPKSGHQINFSNTGVKTSADNCCRKSGYCSFISTKTAPETKQYI